MNYKELNNGTKIPELGYGVYRIPENGVTKDCVLKALKAGYRHIDTAQAYYNEKEVGEAIKESGIDRKEIFLTTKIWVTNFGDNKTIESFDKSLEKLGVEYVDLLLLHQPFGDYYGAWRDLEKIYKSGKAKAIGVSNFWPNRLVDLCGHAEIKPMINQIEVNPFDQKDYWRKWNKKYDVVTEAWGPFAEGRNNMFSNPTLVKIANNHHTGVANVIIRYLLDNDIVVLATTTKEERMKTNQDVYSLELTKEEKEAIKKLDTATSSFFPHESPEAAEFLLSLEEQRKNK